MALYFFRYEIVEPCAGLSEPQTQVEVIVDREEALARKRLMQQHPTACVVQLKQTVFEQWPPSRKRPPT
jgi:hypothetical protein